MSNPATKQKPAKETKSKSRGFEDFFTKDAANAGVKVPLYWPDGRKSDYWLLVAGCDSDVYIQGKLKVDRLGMTRYKSMTDEEAQELHSEEILKLKASCVIDWNMEDNDGQKKAHTFENVVTLLRNAPQLVSEIDDVIYSRAKYVKKK